MLGTLSQTLAAAGKSTHTLTCADGTRVLLLPHGARALGLFPADADKNFYWTNPALGDVDSTRTLFAGGGWHNPGGDRTWLAPELDVFFPDYPDTGKYVQPPQLDMSDYHLERVAGGVKLSRRMALDLARCRRHVELELAKWFGPAANPLRYEKEMLDADVHYAGYTQRTTLRLTGQDDDAPVRLGIWNLLQLPPGGDMLVPTYSRATTQVCFGNMPADSVISSDRLLRVRLSFPGSHKIAVKATRLCGRAGYVYPQGDQWSLVVRNFCVDPSGEYVDVQQTALEDLGYGFQICRVDNQFGDFVELEYHAPATGAPPGPAQSADVSQVWAFRGAKSAVDAIACHLLGEGI